MQKSDFSEYVQKVSIIIPVYNAERYLETCLDSVLKQTLKEIEIICIDDGSLDKSPLILDFYTQKDPRIKTVHKENGGYGQAVNFGMDLAVGQYIAIVEPDDFIDCHMMETLYNVAVSNNLDIVKSDFCEFYGTGVRRTVNTVKLVNDESVYGRVLVPSETEQIFQGYIINPAGIYKKEFLLKYQIRHNETPGASYQDIGFWFQVMTYARRLMLLHDNLYYYRRDNPDSSVLNKEKVYCICDEFNFIYQALTKNGSMSPNMLERYQFCKYKNYLYTFNRIDCKYKHEFLMRMQKELMKERAEGRLKSSCFQPWEYDTISLIIDQPERFYKLYIELPQRIHESTKEYENIIIYGAGTRGKFLLNNMKPRDRKKLLGFAVTEMDGNPPAYNGIMIKEVDYFINVKDVAVVIVGVTKQYEKDVIKALEKKAFQNIVQF